MKWILLVLVCGACARFQPREYTVERTRVVSQTPERVTENVVRWFARNGFNVTMNSGGVVTATSDLRTLDTLVADCGESIEGPFRSNDATVTVTVSPASGTMQGTEVTVVFTPKPPRGTMSSACASTGVIERMILDAAPL